MKLQRAAASGPVDVAAFGHELAKSLPRDTGEFLAVLNTSVSAPTQDISLAQDELVDRISFHDSRATIELALRSTVGPALSSLAERAKEIFGKEFNGITENCEYDSDTRECLMRAHISLSSALAPEELYSRYQLLIDAVASARREAGVGNLEVDIHLV